MNSLMTGRYKTPGGTSVFKKKLFVPTTTTKITKFFLIYCYEKIYFPFFTLSLSREIEKKLVYPPRMVQMKVFAHIVDQIYN